MFRGDTNLYREGVVARRKVPVPGPLGVRQGAGVEPAIGAIHRALEPRERSIEADLVGPIEGLR